MSLREGISDWSKGDRLTWFWRMVRWRERCPVKFIRDVLTVLISRSAHRHGGYIGRGAVFADVPSLPHGLHGVFISRYARIGAGCRIYQNVTIGEVCGRAPTVGDRCLIGAGAILIGGIRIGNDVRIGAGAVVSHNVPDHATVIAQPPRVLIREDAP